MRMLFFYNSDKGHRNNAYTHNMHLNVILMFEEKKALAWSGGRAK